MTAFLVATIISLYQMAWEIATFDAPDIAAKYVMVRDEENPGRMGPEVPQRAIEADFDADGRADLVLILSTKDGAGYAVLALLRREGPKRHYDPVVIVDQAAGPASRVSLATDTKQPASAYRTLVVTPPNAAPRRFVWQPASGSFQETSLPPPASS